MPKALSFVTNSFGVGGYFSILEDKVKVISLPPKSFKSYKREKSMSIAIYYTHEAVCLFTNAKNISFERKSSNAECGTFTLAVLAATVR